MDKPTMALIFSKMKGKNQDSEEGGSSGLAAASALKSALKDGSDEDVLDAFEELYTHCKRKHAAAKESEGGGGSRSEEREDY